jgi:hypothetical protein
MTPQWERAQAPDARDAWERLLAPLARELAGRSDDIAAEIVGQARLHMPELVEEPDGWDGLYGTLDEGARTLMASLERGDDPERVDLPPVTLAFVRETARRGVPIVPLMRVYRFARSVLLADAIARLTELAHGREALGAAAELYSAWLLAYLDRAQLIAEEAYVTERDRWLRSSEASTADAIDAILSGRQDDELLASQRLRHDLRLNHVAVVAWGADAAGLNAALAAIAEHSGSDAVLLSPLGQATRTAWVSRRGAFEGPELDGLTAPGALLALGSSQPGIEGFRQTYHEALEARRVAVLAGRRAGSATRYVAVALAALATADVDQAHAFVRAQLGALAGDDDVALRLAATLRAYLDENASPTRTAKRLGVHENTVANRVRQAEKLLGRPAGEQRLELHVALALAPLVR